MSVNGFIKLHRAMTEWGWYSDSNTKAVFLHLLLTAQWSPGEYKGYKLKPGQAVIGRKALAKALGISEQSVRTSLNHLKSSNEITIESTNKFSIVTIENWAKYQGEADSTDQQSDQQNDQQPTNNRPTTNHIQEYKNKKKDKINSFNREYEEWYKSLPLEERLKISGVIE